MSSEDRVFWLAVREALLMVLRAVETRLNMPHSVQSKRANSAAQKDVSYTG